MQGIIGYSDDDHSGDELKRFSPPKTLLKAKSKDTHLNPISTGAGAPASTSASSSLLPNEPRIRQDTDTLSEPKSARSGKSKAALNASIIRRTIAPSSSNKLAGQPDASTSNDSQDPERDGSAQQTPVEPSLQDLSLGPNTASSSDEGELAQIRALLQPPPIPGVEDFGIPPPSEDKADPELIAKVAKFLELKKQGTHFNDILMRNKSFNNPHIYAKLVDFVDVDETGTNFPKNMWNPHDVQPEWYAEELAATQKKRSSEAAAAQAPGKRARIAFNGASTSAHTAASTSGKHPSAMADKSRQQERERKSRVEGGREAGWSGSSGSNRHHPYPRKQGGDANMGWMPKNHGERPGNKW